MKLLKLLPITSLIWCQFKVGSENTLDIMTWNIENFPKQDNETVDYVDSLITSSNIDIIALQEISSDGYFTQLINELNDPESQNNWVGYRSGTGSWGELAYIINTSTIDIIQSPYTILNSFSHYFAYREPYILEITFSNEQFFIINNHFKCCGNGIIQNDYWDEEYRRQQASLYLQDYINTNLADENVIVLGDLNDELTDPEGNNVFWNFISNPNEYMFVDMDIAEGSPEYWSYPTWPSHIDHILITNELFDNVVSVNTVLYDTVLTEGWNEYEYYISDHRPLYISFCMGENDECDICGGPGAIYECGCEGLIEGTCDCDGNELDACGDCAGNILDSANCNLELIGIQPQNYKMINAYPNPFNSNTTITLQNMGNTFVKLDIIDLNGHIIDSIYSGYLYEKSTHTFLWDASENNSGIYIARISENKKIITHKIILLK